MLCVRQVWMFKCCVLDTPVQRALLAGSLESHKHFTTEKKRLLKEAGSISILRSIASHSMTKTWKMSRAISSNPLLCMFALCLVFSMSLLVPNLAWGFSQRENVLLTAGSPSFRRQVCTPPRGDSPLHSKCAGHAQEPNERGKKCVAASDAVDSSEGEFNSGDLSRAVPCFCPFFCHGPVFWVADSCGGSFVCARGCRAL